MHGWFVNNVLGMLYGVLKDEFWNVLGMVCEYVTLVRFNPPTFSEAVGMLESFCSLLPEVTARAKQV